MAISVAIGQSCKITHFEELVDNAIEDTEVCFVF
jgi:uncharacterized Rmd1/YagE family protein